MDINSLTPFYFDWAVKHMADMAIRLAKEPRPQRRELRWNTLLAAPEGSHAGSPEPAPVPEGATVAAPTEDA
jgi:hypothetical protein